MNIEKIVPTAVIFATIDGVEYIRCKNGELWIELDYDGDQYYVYEFVGSRRIARLEYLYREAVRKDTYGEFQEKEV